MKKMEAVIIIYSKKIKILQNRMQIKKLKFLQNGTVFALTVNRTPLAGSNNRVLDHIIQQLQEQFGDIKVESGNQLSYLNIRFNFNPNGELVLDMTQYKKNLVEGLVLPTNVMLPGTTKLMERTDDSPLLNDE